MTSLVGQRLDGYQIVERLLGAPSDTVRPGDTEVYRGVAFDGQTPVAIRIFPRALAEPGQIDRLRQELAAASHLIVPGVPATLGSGLIEGKPYVITPYFAAGSLADRLRTGLYGSLDAGELLDQLAAILSHAHRRRIVHGQLRPSKLLFDEESGALHVVGLGEAPARDLSSAGVPPEHAIYAAPEITAGLPLTPAADQYSFAVIGLELLAQTPAVEAMSALRAHSVDRQPDVELGISRETVLALSRATVVNPDLRFADIEEANRALQIALGNLPPVVAPIAQAVARPERRKKRRFGFGAVAALVVLLALAGAIPALSAGLIRLPGGDREYAAATAGSSEGGEPGITLPTQDPSAMAGELSSADDESMATEGQAEPPGDDGAEAAPGGSSEGPSATATASALSTSSGEAPTPTPTPTSGEVEPPTSTNTPPATSTEPSTPTNTPVPAEPTRPPTSCSNNPSLPTYCTPTP